MQHFVGQPLWLDSTPSIAQKIEYVDQSWPGNNPLVTYVTETHAKIAEKLGLQFVTRGKVSMAALTRKHMMLGTVPIHSSFAKASPGGDHRLIADRSSFNLIQRDQVTGIKKCDAPGIGLEIIDEQCFFKIQIFGVPFGLNDPRKIGGFDTAIAYRAGNPKTSSLGMNIRSSHKFGNDLIQTGVFAARKNRG